MVVKRVGDIDRGDLEAGIVSAPLYPGNGARHEVERKVDVGDDVGGGIRGPFLTTNDLRCTVLWNLA